MLGSGDHDPTPEGIRAMMQILESLRSRSSRWSPSLRSRADALLERLDSDQPPDDGDALFVLMTVLAEDAGVRINGLPEPADAPRGPMQRPEGASSEASGRRSRRRTSAATPGPSSAHPGPSKRPCRATSGSSAPRPSRSSRKGARIGPAPSWAKQKHQPPEDPSSPASVRGVSQSLSSLLERVFPGRFGKPERREDGTYIQYFDVRR